MANVAGNEDDLHGTPVTRDEHRTEPSSTLDPLAGGDKITSVSPASSEVALSGDGLSWDSKATVRTIVDKHLNSTLVFNSFKSTLAGIAMSGNLGFMVREGLIHLPGDSGGNFKPGLSPSPAQYALQHIANYADTVVDRSNNCAPAWQDPRNSVMAKLNELMFRTRVYVAQHYKEEALRPLLDEGLTSNSTVTGTLISPIEVLHSDLNLFAGTAAMQLLAIIVILLTFYRWWDIGRSATLSPLEIAKAFDAPMLSTVLGKSSGREVDRLLGARRVRYGAVATAEDKAPSCVTSEHQRLAIGDLEDVTRPHDDARTVKEHYHSITSAVQPRREVDRRVS